MGIEDASSVVHHAVLPRALLNEAAVAEDALNFPIAGVGILEIRHRVVISECDLFCDSQRVDSLGVDLGTPTGVGLENLELLLQSRDARRFTLD